MPPPAAPLDTASLDSAAVDTAAWPIGDARPAGAVSGFVHYEPDPSTVPITAPITASTAAQTPELVARPAPTSASPAASRPVAWSGGRPVDDWEARCLAGAFAADLLSWDEDEPGLWRMVIARYLPGIDPAALGVWSGTGRQRVEVVLPGLVRRDGPTRVRVEVRVRITVYVSNPRAPHAPTAPEQPPLPAHMVASSAPAPAAAGWRGCSARWARLMVPITRNLAGELVINPALAQGKEPAP